MISVPIAAHIKYFEWQIDLFWYCHKKLYNEKAYKKALVTVCKRNFYWETKKENLLWNTDVPHIMTDSFFDFVGAKINHKDFRGFTEYLPINIQYSLLQCIDRFHNDDIIELLDADMFHFKPHPPFEPRQNEVIVADIYENWYLKSRTSNRIVLTKYLKGIKHQYNGGYVPIIARVSTFKKILQDWIRIHVDILSRNFVDNKIYWWAGMYSFQAACALHNVKMIAMDLVYVPSVNHWNQNHYITHYSGADNFPKRIFPRINPDKFESNTAFDLIKEWFLLWQKNNIDN
jgi:hypothetical protein